MQLYQILVRPSEATMIVVYDDPAGNRHNIHVDTGGNATVSALTAQCQQLLPTDSANPAKAEIQKEITNLESRITQLKAAIGVV